MSAVPPSCDVFLCHSGVEKHIVLQLYFALRYLGDQSATSVFFDRAYLTASKAFDVELLKALSSARVGLLWLSSSFFNAPWCLLESSLLMMQSGTIDSKTAEKHSARLSSSSDQELEEMGFDSVSRPWLSGWLTTLSHTDISACSVYPVFYDSAALKNATDIRSPMFRMPLSDYRRRLAKASGATNPSSLTLKPLLKKTIQEVRFILLKTADTRLTEPFLDRLVDACSAVSNTLHGDETQPALSAAFDRLRLAMAASAAGASSGPPSLMINVTGGEKTTFDGFTGESALEGLNGFLERTGSRNTTISASSNLNHGQTTFTLFNGKR